ncbi:MAG: hypothetical protein IPH16_06960 [Haliscomenobacter sp.]|nr:hypothetical protein [Haliscomenobacter sp.]
MLFLAVPEESYLMLINDELLQEFIGELGIKFLLFDPIGEKIVSWIK